MPDIGRRTLLGGSAATALSILASDLLPALTPAAHAAAIVGAPVGLASVVQ